ncbi:MAG: M16 family metallopeptidase, partial [Fidelibacterota bacterium]
VERESDKNRIFLVDHDMKQAEIIFLSKGEKYNPDNVAERTLFNSYYGGSMSSVAFQTIRESKALAYSVFATYNDPGKKDDSHYVMAYIGTQADKLPEAMSAMFELLNELPESESSFQSSKDAVSKKIQSDRVTRASVLFNYLTAKRRGLDHDIRKDVYSKLDQMSIDDVKSFFDNYVKGRNYQIMVIGNVEDLDLATLAGYGEIKYLSLEEVFGY